MGRVNIREVEGPCCTYSYVRSVREQFPKVKIWSLTVREVIQISKY